MNTTDYKLVPLSSIHVDDRYQRALRLSVVRKIASEFSWDKFGTPVVAIRTDGDGRMYVVDGQHRITAAREKGLEHEEIIVDARYGLTEAEEAELFLGLNDKTNPTPLDKYLAGLVAGDPTILAIDEIVASLGLKVTYSGSTGTVRAVQALRKVYIKSPDALRAALTTIVNAWGLDTVNFERSVLEGVGLVFADHADIVTVRELSEKLAARPGRGGGLLGDARSRQGMYGGTVAKSVAATIALEWNKGRRSRRLPVEF